MNASEHTSHRDFYDRISNAYDLIADSSERTCRLKGIKALELQPGEQVLEIGFGTGNGLIELAEFVGPQGQVTGLDISTGMREVAKCKIEKQNLSESIQLVIGSALELPFKESAFDAAFMSFTLELFDDDQIPIVLRQIKHVLKPGGKFVVVAMSLQQEEGKNTFMIRSYQWFHKHFPHIVDCRPIDVLQVLSKAGFIIKSIQRESIWTLDIAIIAAKIAAKPPSCKKL